MTRKALLILGMHRSGTSITAGMCDVLGVYGGRQEELLPPDEGNPKGYFEHKDLVNLNEEMLAMLDCNWFAPPIAPIRLTALLENLEFKAKAKELIHNLSLNRELIYLKDPRLCVLLPFWLEVLKEYEVHALISLRNPLSVARSLEKRDHFDRYYSLSLWETYLSFCLQHLSQFKSYRVFSFESFVHNNRPTVKKLIEMIANLQEIEPSAENAAYAFVEGKFERNKSDQTLANNNELPTSMKNLEQDFLNLEQGKSSSFLFQPRIVPEREVMFRTFNELLTVKHQSNLKTNQIVDLSNENEGLKSLVKALQEEVKNINNHNRMLEEKYSKLLYSILLKIARKIGIKF